MFYTLEDVTRSLSIFIVAFVLTIIYSEK